MINDFIILQLLLPLVAATFLFLNSNKQTAYFVTTVISGLLTAISLYIAYNSYLTEHRYFFGGWLPPLGIELLVNFSNSVMLVLISTAALLTFVLGHKSIFNYKNINLSSFCSLFLITLTGTYGVVLTNDFFNLYVFIEISSIALYALTSIGTKQSTKAAFNYLIIGTIGAILILMGIGFLYSVSGTLNINDFIKILPHIDNTKLLILGCYFIIVGLALKSSLFPLHSWLVDLYSSTNSIILPFISAVSTKIYIFVLIKMVTYILPFHDIITTKLSLLSIIGMIVTSLAATQQKTIRTVLAYSSLTNICYIIAILHIKNSIIFGLILIVNHSITKFSLFILTNHIIHTKKTDNIESLHNIIVEMPMVVILFIINAASLVGLPLTLGFISKFYLLAGLIQQDNWHILAAIVTSSFISLIYLWKMIEVMITKTDSTQILSIPQNNNIQQDHIMTYGLLALSLANIIIGILFVYAPFNIQFH